MQTNRPQDQAVSGNLSTWYSLLLFLIAGLGLLCIRDVPVSKYSIFNRTWGFDHIFYYGATGKLIFVAILLLLIIPYTNKLIGYGFHWLSRIFDQSDSKKIFVFILCSCLSVFVFYLLRVKYYFLGDFNIRLIQTMKKEFLTTEYLSMRLLYIFASLAGKAGFTAEQSFKLYSNICGGLFVFISLLIADLCGKSNFQKLILFLSQVASALVLVFCGYVEIYATPILLLSLYFYFSLRYLKQKSGFLMPVLCLGLAIFSHLLCLAAIPSLVVIYYFNNEQKLRFVSARSNRSIAFWLFILIFLSLIAAVKIKSGFFLAVSAPFNAPRLLTLFDHRHFWELLNGQILVCGLSFFFVFILLLKSIREKRQLLAEHYFLLGVCGCFLLLLFMANLQRGSGDWDIMSFSAVSLNLLVAMLIFHLHADQSIPATYLAVAIFGFNAVNAFLWLQINHSDRSIQKVEGMLTNDPGTYYTTRISGPVQLAFMYKNNKLMTYSQRIARQACNDGDKKGCTMYGMGLKDLGQLDEAARHFEDVIQNKSPYVLEAYIYLAEYFARKRDYQKLGYYLGMLLDSFTERPDDFINNTNFKKDVMIKLFEALDSITPAENIKRKQQITAMINALKNFTPPSQKNG